MPEDTSSGAPAYVQRGGARIGRSYWVSLNFTIPFAKLSVTSEAVSLSVHFLFFKRQYLFQRANISAIRRYKGYVSRGVKLEHDKEGCPPFIVFWTTDLKELLANLQSCGYHLFDT